MLIPHGQLSPEALQGIVDEFIAREGAGDPEAPAPSLAQKRAWILDQLEKGLIFVVYDEASDSVDIVGKHHPSLTDR